MVDRISSTEELVIWIVGFVLCVWMVCDTRRVLKLFTFVPGYSQSARYVTVMRALAGFVALMLGVQIVMHVLKS